MIWIHGGAYCIGSSKLYGYTGITNNFASRDIIVVTIQYRLGPYGKFRIFVYGDCCLPAY